LTPWFWGKTNRLASGFPEIDAVFSKAAINADSDLSIEALYKVPGKTGNRQ
jgi:hypothetical protein